MLTLILKSTNACNLRCAYCSLGDKTLTRTLSEAEILKGLEWFAEDGKEKGEKTLSVIFHGGEPMMIPAPQYSRCIEQLMERYPDISWQYYMQTNGTILGPDYIDLLKRYDIHVGISLDGPEGIHDAQRKTRGGENTFGQIVENITCLKENGVSVSALMVLTKAGLNEDLAYLEKFCEMELPLKINPLLNEGEARKHQELALGPGDYGDYIKAVFNYVIDHEVDIRVSPLEDMLEAVLYGRRPRGCTFREECNDSFICVNQCGDIYPCGRFADAYSHKAGDIWRGISQEGQKALKRLRQRRCVNLAEACLKCRYADLCRGGCGASAKDGPGGSKETVMCEDYRRIFDYLYGDGIEKYRRYLLTRKDRILQQLQK